MWTINNILICIMYEIHINISFSNTQTLYTSLTVSCHVVTWKTSLSNSLTNLLFLIFLYSKRPVRFFELVEKAETWLIKSYWYLEFPHTLLPNFYFFGGLHCKLAQPLFKVNMFAFFFWLCVFHLEHLTHRKRYGKWDKGPYQAQNHERTLQRTCNVWVRR